MTVSIDKFDQHQLSPFLVREYQYYLLKLEDMAFKDFALQVSKGASLVDSILVNDSMSGLYGHYTPAPVSDEVHNHFSILKPLINYFTSPDIASSGRSGLFDGFLFLPYSIREIYSIDGNVFYSLIENILNIDSNQKHKEWTQNIKDSTHGMYTLDEHAPEVHNIYVLEHVLTLARNSNVKNYSMLDSCVTLKMRCGLHAVSFL